MSDETELSLDSDPIPNVPLSTMPRPAEPRPPMTFDQQADLLEHLHGRMSPMADGRRAITITLYLDQPMVDDLWLTAQRLRRMARHETEIKYVVTGK